VRSVIQPTKATSTYSIRPGGLDSIRPHDRHTAYCATSSSNNTRSAVTGIGPICTLKNGTLKQIPASNTTSAPASSPPRR